MQVAAVALLALCVLLTCNFDACGVPAQPGSPAGGFPVTTYSVTEDQDGNILSTGVVPYTEVSGNWVSGGTGGSVTSFGVNSPFLTDENGNGFVNNGVVNADWTTTVGWPSTSCPAFSGSNTDALYVDPIAGIPWVCIFIQYTEEDNTSTHYALSGAAPSTITAYGDLVATYGDPGLRVYVGGASPSLVNVMSATSTTPGLSAVFPFPTQPNGSPLPEGFYGLLSTSINSAGNAISTGSPSYLAIGGTTDLSAPFGVDAVDIHTTYVAYHYKVGGKGCTESRTDSVAPSPMFTQYYTNEVMFGSSTFPVGSGPVAIKAFGSNTVTTYTPVKNCPDDSKAVTGPAGAIAVNSLSNSVTLINFAGNSTVNIAVGTQPMAVVLSSDGSKAYIPNFGSGTLSEVNIQPRA